MRMPLPGAVLAALLLALLPAGLQAADTPEESFRPDVLPRWETEWEKAQPAPSRELDEVTPPPPNPVQLAGEFAHQAGVIVRYPYGNMNAIFTGMVDAFQDVGIVYVLVADASTEAACLSTLDSYGVPHDNLEFIHVATNAIWTRDYGPWFVEDGDSLAVSDMRYYDHRPADNAIPEHLHEAWGTGYYMGDFYHEGGNMMTDGHGRMFMTTRVLERNPGMTEAQVRSIYRDYFGQDTTFIFQRIAFDGTGHIDLWAKILNDTTIMVAQLEEDDPNYTLVEQHAAEMAQINAHTGRPFHVVRCPMPPLIQTGGGDGYYRSYINSKLFNYRAVIPIYGLETDAAAIAAYQDALGPEWEVIGIDCNQIVPMGGAIHCTAIGVPHGAGSELLAYLLGRGPALAPRQSELEATLRLVNAAADTDTIGISLAATLPEGWSCSYTTPAGEQTGEGSVVLGGSSTYDLVMTLATGAANESAEVTLSAASSLDTSRHASYSFFHQAAGEVLLLDSGSETHPDHYTAALDSVAGQGGAEYAHWTEADRTLNFGELEEAGVEVLVWANGAPMAMESRHRTGMLGFLSAGGHLLLPGRDVVTALGTTLWDRLDVHVGGLHDGPREAQGVEGDPVSDGLVLALEGGDGLEQEPEPLFMTEPTGEGRVAFHYTEGEIAGIRTQTDSGRALTLGFPFEAVASAGERAELMAEAVHWLRNGGENATPGGQADAAPPRRFALAPPTPNPFNPATTLAYTLPRAGRVELVVYDLLGRKVAELAAGHRRAGEHRAHWNAAERPSGLYFARITLVDGEGRAHSALRKLTLVK